MTPFHAPRRLAAALAAVTCGAALLGVAPHLSRPAFAQDAAPAAPAAPPKLDYQETRLANGLKVITLEDHRAPVVTLQVWYKVGSKEEPQGKAGFAHLFEHLMFKGGKAVGSEQHARYVEALGANYNADTSFDRTRYYETVPSNALDRVLFLEADRMTSLRVDAPNLKSERDVVEEEYRLRVANAPYGKLIDNVLQMVYPAGHPYYHTTIGSIPDLDSAKLADVKAFHDTYYKPDNATLVLVGDFKTADALAKINKYYGSIPKSKTGVFPRLPLAPVAPTQAKNETFYDKLAPLPLIGIAFHLPKPTSADAPVFDVMSIILSGGKGSRLYRSLVRDQQIAVQSAGQSLELQQGGIYFFFAVANAGKKPQDVADALQAEITRLQDTSVSDEELTKAKNQALTGEVFGQLSTEGKASALGEADLLYGTPAEANAAYEKLTKVTASDIQRVAKEYFAKEKSNTFFVLPAAMQAKPAAGTNTTNPKGIAAK